MASAAVDDAPPPRGSQGVSCGALALLTLTDEATRALEAKTVFR